MKVKKDLSQMKREISVNRWSIVKEKLKLKKRITSKRELERKWIVNWMIKFQGRICWDKNKEKWNWWMEKNKIRKKKLKETFWKFEGKKTMRYKK